MSDSLKVVVYMGFMVGLLIFTIYHAHDYMAYKRWEWYCKSYNSELIQPLIDRIEELEKLHNIKGE